MNSPPQGMIEAIYLDEGELISAGVDGFIRVGVMPCYECKCMFCVYICSLLKCWCVLSPGMGL